MNLKGRRESTNVTDWRPGKTNALIHFNELNKNNHLDNITANNIGLAVDPTKRNQLLNKLGEWKNQPSNDQVKENLNHAIRNQFKLPKTDYKYDHVPYRLEKEYSYKVEYDPSTRSFSLKLNKNFSVQDQNKEDQVSQDDRNKARETERKLRNDLRAEWRNFRNIQKSGDQNRISNAKAKIDSKTKNMLAAREISNTSPGSKPNFKYDFDG